MLIKLIGAKNLLAASGVKYVSHDTKGDIVEYDVDIGVARTLLKLVNDKNMPYFSTVGDLEVPLEDDAEGAEDDTGETDSDEVTDEVPDAVAKPASPDKKKTTIKVGGKKAEKSVSV